MPAKNMARDYMRNPIISEPRQLHPGTINNFLVIFQVHFYFFLKTFKHMSYLIENFLPVLIRFSKIRIMFVLLIALKYRM